MGPERCTWVFIFTQPDAIILVYRARPPGATESRIVDLQVPIIWTKCRFGGRRPWFNFPTTDGRTLILSGRTELTKDQKLLARQLKLDLLPQPPPRITAPEKIAYLPCS